MIGPNRAVLWRNSVRLLVLVLGLIGAGAAFSARFGIAVDPKASRCLPYSVYLLDRGDTAPQRLAYFAFLTHDVPFFENGSPLIKQMAGMPGDTIDIDGSTLRIAGRPWGALNADVMTRAHLTVEAVVRHDQVKANRYLMLGTSAQSYDGRYWGDISGGQLFARAYPLW